MPMEFHPLRTKDYVNFCHVFYMKNLTFFRALSNWWTNTKYYVILGDR